MVALVYVSLCSLVLFLSLELMLIRTMVAPSMVYDVMSCGQWVCIAGNHLMYPILISEERINVLLSVSNHRNRDQKEDVIGNLIHTKLKGLSGNVYAKTYTIHNIHTFILVIFAMSIQICYWRFPVTNSSNNINVMNP